MHTLTDLINLCFNHNIGIAIKPVSGDYPNVFSISIHMVDTNGRITRHYDRVVTTRSILGLEDMVFDTIERDVRRLERIYGPDKGVNHDDRILRQKLYDSICV